MIIKNANATNLRESDKSLKIGEKYNNDNAKKHKNIK